MKNKKLLIIIISAVLAVCLAVVGTIVIVKLANSSSDTAVVKFDVNIDLETNVIQEREIKIGRRVSQPKAFITEENPTNLQVYGWYTTKECKEENKWDFKNGRVEGSMTLYAKWVELYDVDYYVNGEYNSTVNVFNGDLLEETADLVKGYKYLGSFTTEDYAQKFDFTKPITAKTNVYVKRSQGIYLSDSIEEGLLSSGNLTNYLTAACGSYPAGTEEGWVEEYVIESTGEKCTYVNFGYTPEIPDGYVELSLNLDISESQIIKITYKNLGPAQTMTCYFTAMLDENTYSETGAWYNGNFCWPNVKGNGPIDIESNMSEDDEWVTVELNLYEIYQNGYSIWGTSPFLGAIRFEVGHKNQNEDDWTNEMLIKSIEGVPHEIIVDDTDEIKQKMVSASDADLESAGSLLASVDNGISFVKDHAGLGEVSSNAQVFKTTKGMLFYAENEVDARESGETSASFTIGVPQGREISLEDLTTLRVQLQNFGYAEQLIVYVYNNQNVPVKTTLDIASRMPESSEYVVNMYGLFGMEGTFSRIEFVYTSVGVDNLILFEKVYFTEFVAYDSVGINFNDKNCYGFETVENKVNVKFDVKNKGIEFDVKQTGAVITSPDVSYDATNEGYAYMALKYNKPATSGVTKVMVELKVGGIFKSVYEYELTESGKTVISQAIPLKLDESGYVKAVRLTFEGTGKIVLTELVYTVNETSLPFYNSYSKIYESFQDWKGNNGANVYEYNQKEKISTFIKGPNMTALNSVSLYIGYSYSQTSPHVTKSIKVTGKITVTLVYQNKTDTDKIDLALAFDPSDIGPCDGSGYSVYSQTGLDIDSNMGDYEWSAVSITVEGAALEEYLDAYFGKVYFTFLGDRLSVRAISITVEE